MEGVEPQVAADRIQSKVQPLGQRFYPSTSAFPLRESIFVAAVIFSDPHTGRVPAGHVASLLVRFMLANKGAVPYGWAPRILIQCGVPYADVWYILHDMYESQVCSIFLKA